MSAARVLIAALVWFSLWPIPAGAQQQTVFVHGLKSDGGTWEATARRLSEQFAINPKWPSLNWRATYDDQAEALNANSELNGINLVVGHSNGGVVARRWARLRPLAGIVTIGTPHRGAPLVSNVSLYGRHTAAAVGSMIDAGQAIGHVANARLTAFEDCCDWSWLAQQVLSSLSVTTGLMDFGYWGMLGTLGLTLGAPVIGQMEPASGFISDLNSPDSVARESAEVPIRIGVVSSAPFWGGPFRVIAPDDAEVLGWVVKGSAWTLYFVAGEIMARHSPADWEAWDVAYRLLTAGSYLDALDASWCAAVSSVGMQYCDFNDAVVPVWSQQFPNAVNIYTGNEVGPVHGRETESADPWVQQALAHYAHVPRRADPARTATRLNPGQGLSAGQSAASSNGRFVLRYQTDGNLVLYDNGTAVWAIDCWPQCSDRGDAGSAVMQEDGNFVVRDAGGGPFWHTSTPGNPGAYLAVQDDGNLVVYGSGGNVLWQR